MVTVGGGGGLGVTRGKSSKKIVGQWKSLGASFSPDSVVIVESIDNITGWGAFVSGTFAVFSIDMKSYSKDSYNSYGVS